MDSAQSELGPNRRLWVDHQRRRSPGPAPQRAPGAPGVYDRGAGAALTQHPRAGQAVLLHFHLGGSQEQRSGAVVDPRTRCGAVAVLGPLTSGPNAWGGVRDADALIDLSLGCVRFCAHSAGTFHSAKNMTSTTPRESALRCFTALGRRTSFGTRRAISHRRRCQAVLRHRCRTAPSSAD